VAKKLADGLCGPKGPRWGTTLTESEAVLRDARGVITETLLTLAVERQAEHQRAQRPAEYQHCPTGQRTPKPRQLRTRVAAAAWDEPRQYCTRCRRAFFPTVANLG
jgi:hypothetical protein